MKAALFLLATLALTATQIRAAQQVEGTADCPALASSRVATSARTEAILNREDSANRETSSTSLQNSEEVRGGSGNWVTPLLKLGKRSSEGLVVSDSSACRVALNASFGKVTPVAAKGWTTVVTVTW